MNKAAWWSDEDGQDIVEYALIAALISTAVISTMMAFGKSVESLWNLVANGIPK